MESNHTLLSSAKDFIIESLNSYRDWKLNFAILHSVSAAELLLKEKLSRIHPNLIYKNIDAKDFTNEHSVSLRNLPHRLINFGVPIHVREVRFVENMAKWRNQILHHMPTFDKELADFQLKHLLDFLAKFLKRELNAPLESFLPKNLYKTVNGLLKEWEYVISEARRKANKEGGILAFPCPDCGTTLVLCLRDEKRVFCHLCKAKRYYYDYCTDCKKKTVGTFSTFDEGNWCDECLNAAGEAYGEMLGEIERGK